MGRPFQIGVQLPEVEREVTWREVRDIARTAEEVGFDSIWVGDHLLYRRPEPRGPWEAWSLLAALAESTDRVALGPLVASTSFHAPAMLAKKAATIDEISGGRLILGLGAGWNRVEYDAFGFPYDNRVSRFEEAFTIVVTLLRAGEIDFTGRFHTVRDCVLSPPARADIPLLLGSNGPRMLRFAVPHVDLWNTWYSSYGNTVDGLLALQDQVDAACRDVGRDPETLGRTAAILVGLPGGVRRAVGSSERPTVTPLSGSPDELSAALLGFAGAGVEHVQLVLDPIDVRSVEAMGDVLALMDR